MDLKICSLNVRGLGDRNKRREIFNWLRSKQYSIYLLQEVHCVETTTNSWAAEWGYKTAFSCCSSAQAGVAFLFNNNFSFQLHRLFSDPNGGFIICDLKTGEKVITLVSIYAPNEDDPSFFRGFFGHLSDFQCEDLRESPCEGQAVESTVYLTNFPDIQHTCVPSLLH